MPSSKPNFATWDRTVLARLAHDLWDQNVVLRGINEQLRLDNKDLSKINRDLLTKGAKDDHRNGS